MIVNLIYNCIIGKFPPQALRIWFTGSQACEEVFRLLRSMTSTFSTIVNFSMKGIFERIHKLNYLSSMECSSDVAFPRVKRRLLQIKDESEKTFEYCTVDDIKVYIDEAKEEAIELTKTCGMVLPSYNDEYLLEDTMRMESVINDAINVDGEIFENDDDAQLHGGDTIDYITVQEDISNLRLAKQSSSGLPTYGIMSNDVPSDCRTYSYKNNNKTPFIQYQNRYIRKSTALYLIQENLNVSNDRLLRVRSNQPSHIYHSKESTLYPKNHIKSGDLCIFKREGMANEHLIGRIVQFSYLSGSKRDRQFSGDFIDLSKDISNIGIFCNWYCIANYDDPKIIAFKSTYDFTQGYLPSSNYVFLIDEKMITYAEDFAFGIPIDYLEKNLKSWRTTLV